jgi:hypothetical protein
LIEIPSFIDHQYAGYVRALSPACNRPTASASFSAGDADLKIADCVYDSPLLDSAG